MNEPNTRVDVFHRRGGQPRPYADSVYESDLVFSNWWESTKGPRKGNWCPDEKAARVIANLLVRHFEDEPKYLLSPRLESIVKIAPDTWRVVIVEPYCD